MQIYENIMTGLEETKKETAFLLDVSPNPSGGCATASFELLQMSYIELIIFDIMGRIVEIPVAGSFSAGQHQVYIGELPSGIYLARLQISGQSATRTFAVIR